MRHVLLAVPLALTAIAPVFVLACGGDSKKPPATSADNVDGEEGPGFAKGDGGTVAIKPEDGGGASTTTTATLTDTDAGTKLAPAASGSATSSATTAVTGTPTAAATSISSAPQPGQNQQGCDPGRCVPDIYAEVQSRRALARACYDAALKDHPGIEGKLVIAFEIDPKGNVTKTSANPQETEPAMNESGLVSCVGDVIKKIKFPESPRGRLTRANYRYEFHPKGR